MNLAEDETETDYGGMAITLRVRDRVCVVVGGGPVAERKAQELCRAGAQVTVVAPQVTDSLQLLMQEGRLHHQKRRYESSDVAGAFIVVAATSDPDVNRQVTADARAAGALVNRAGSVDGDAEGDFDVMAMVRRGPLLIGITAGGASPSVAARLRTKLSQTFGLEWAVWVTLLGEMRHRAKAEIADDAVRADFLRRLAARDDLVTRLAKNANAMDRGQAGVNSAEVAFVREEVETMLSEAIQAGTGQRDAGDVCPAQ